MAACNAMNGAKSLGFGSCPIGGFDAVKHSKILKLPFSLVLTLIVPIGFAADTPHAKIRSPKEEVFF